VGGFPLPNQASGDLEQVRILYSLLIDLFVTRSMDSSTDRRCLPACLPSI